MRVHINLDAALVRELDRRVGPRRRSAFIARAVEEALKAERRWELVETALGTISERGHAWDEDAASWVRDQRRADNSCVG